MRYRGHAHRSDDNNALEANETGRIQISGVTVMQGYWKNVERTEQVFVSGGWLDTGDLGYLDYDGYLYLSGRADDTINCGGEKIMPLELEAVAQDFAGVKDCGCIGIDDPNGLLGQIPMVFRYRRQRRL